ncbi:ABC transporter permease [Caballeronia sp. GAWG2-1]|uniref:ABC transporter permease n=1 Tax=Caballeronia sp. GAWG2-1 TaxID=2921744 RepID=UPI002028EA8F|nr:ABC transporter permease [Caballeronia sp. GAWG2-1]
MNQVNPGTWPRLNPIWCLLLPMIILVGCLYLVPVINVLLMSVSEPHVGLENYHRMMSARGPLRVLFTTLRVSAITTVLAVLAGYIVSYAMANVGEMHRRILMLGVVIPLWISVLIRSLSWMVLLADNGPVNSSLIHSGLVSAPVHFVNNEIGVVIGMTHYLLPYAVLPIFAAMRDIDQRLLFASRSLGAGATRTFLKVYLPLTIQGAFAATVIVFVFGLGFYVTPAILGGGRVVMMAESINVEIMQTLRWGFGAAQAVFLLVITVVLVRLMAKTVGFKKGLGS